MNPNNYASLEASKRLVEAGIVIETEKYWYQDMHGWYLGLTPTVVGKHTPKHIPALSMAEAWRELKKYVNANPALLKNVYNALLSEDTIDDLIHLLVWVRKERKDGPKP